ncbi:hypothetical protein SKAU_G00393860 [Synaphobranchus kaupii]|uniref:Solute carrier family 25 member 51b n=1 Tax=Synaphobranchus kaupii TaxID=118154 RepID=A0A9Q1IBV4_SYNKA|nr:hypothetical protein SKAU_G00393860 [Synaphobranchus kaupii]
MMMCLVQVYSYPVERHDGGIAHSELAAYIRLHGANKGRHRRACVTVDGGLIVSMGVAVTMDPEAQQGKQGKAVLLPGLDQRKKHYVCGSCAAFTNISVTFPIQKVLFRQQLFGVRASEAVTQLQRDGLRNLYRGLLPPLLQKTTTVAIMFGLYEDFSRLLAGHAGGAPELLTRSLAAVLAGTAEAALTPFERVQTLLQDPRNHGRFHNTFHTFGTLLRDHGVRECYRGLLPILLRNGPSNALFFGLRGPIKQQLPEAQSPAANLVNDFICGGLLGAMLGFMFYPLNVLKARMQAQVGGAFQPSRAVLLTIWRERDGKVTHLFRGAQLNYYRSILSWGIINATYELLLKFL